MSNIGEKVVVNGAKVVLGARRKDRIDVIRPGEI